MHQSVSSSVIGTFVAVLALAPDRLLGLGERMKVAIEIRSRSFADSGEGYRVTGNTAEKAAMDRHTPLFVHEWSRYSPAVMAKAKVTKIIFCQQLALNGQIRAAVPAYGLGSMYYDPNLGSYAPDYQRGVIHHEFFHMMEQQMKTADVDPEWAKLNLKDFHYGTGGENMRKNGVGGLTRDIPGFITPYGTSAIEEDKAELYSHLIVDPAFVAEQGRKDPMLAAKIALLKKRMEAFDPLFNSRFWPAR